MKTLIICVLFLIPFFVGAEDISKFYHVNNPTISSNEEYSMVSFNNKYYFIAKDGTDRQVWSYDSNNNIKKETNLSEIPNELFVLNDKLYIYTSDNDPSYNPLVYGAHTIRSIWEYTGTNSAKKIINNLNIDEILSTKIFDNKLYYWLHFYNTDGYFLYSFDGVNHTFQHKSNQYIFDLVVMDNKLYFNAFSSSVGNELFCISSGVESLVSDILVGKSGSNPQNISLINNRLFFVANDSIHGDEVWTYDGINEPVITGDIKSGINGSVNRYHLSIIGFKNKTFFIANDGISGYKLWSFDSQNNLHPESDNLPDIAGSHNFEMFLYNEKLYFYCSGNIGLYEYDGNEPYKKVFDYNPYIPYNNSKYKAAQVIFENNLYISGKCNVDSFSIWKYNGNDSPVNISGSIPIDNHRETLYLDVINSHVSFSQGSRLWLINNDTISLITDVFPYEHSFHRELFNKVFFWLDHSFYGNELWSFDGINTPTIVADINKTLVVPKTLSLKEENGKLYFPIMDTITKYVEYDGSNFKILNSDFNPLTVYNKGKFKEEYYYIDKINKYNTYSQYGLFKYNGVNTSYVFKECKVFPVLNDHLILNYYNDLYKYDGINQPEIFFNPDYSYDIWYSRVFKNKLLFFTAYFLETISLWEYDGINEPVRIMATPIFDNRNDYKFNEFKDKFYYAADNGINGIELWSYDGVNEPSMAFDINIGNGSSKPTEMTLYNNKLYFTADDGTHGTELWEYDGIVSPKMVSDIEPGTNSSSPKQLIVCNNKLYFVANTKETGNELWVYDGINSPHLISDLMKGSVGSEPNDLIDYKNDLYLSALTENEGRQLFKVCTNCTLIQLEACDSINYNGKIYTSSGIYYDTLQGTDTIIKLALTINKSVITNIKSSACYKYNFFDRILTETGTYKQILPAVSGCDSIINLNLTINQNSYDSISPIACEIYNSPGGKSWSASGTYYDTIPNSCGCDSIITINLTINQNNYDSISPKACETYISPSGRKYISSGTYFETIPNSCGCDSIITINLTVNHNTMANQQVKTCNEYTSPSAKYIWKESGTYLDTIPNACSCDSIIKVELNLQHIDSTVSLMPDGAELVSNDTLSNHQWVDCNEDFKPIAGQSGQSFKPTQSGNYAVVVSYGWCSDTSECIQVNTTGIEPNTAEKGIKIYPNPTSGKFTIDLGYKLIDAFVTIAEMDGRVILNQKYENQQVLILDLSGQNGIYLIAVTTNNYTRIFRIIKE